MSTITAAQQMTLADIAKQLGYADTEAVRKLWARTPVLRDTQFSQTHQPTDIQLGFLLGKLSKKTGQRDPQIADNANRLANQLGVKLLEVSDEADSENEPSDAQPSPSKPATQQYRRPAPIPMEKSHAMPTTNGAVFPAGTVNGGLPPVNGIENAGHGDSKPDNSGVSEFITPDTLSWAVNFVHWVLILSGCWNLGGLVGFALGGMVVLLSAYMQILVRDSDNGDTAGWAVFFTFCFCCLSGWLIEYPSLKNAFFEKEKMLPLAIGYYAGIVAAVASGSAFVAVYLRYKRSLNRWLLT